MQRLGKYRWIALILLAVISQFVVVRITEASLANAIGYTNISKLAYVVFAAAPQITFASNAGKEPTQNANSTTGKAIGSNSGEQPASTGNTLAFLSGTEYQERSPSRLWLLNCALLL